MRVIGHVAVNVFKESVRDKILYNLVVFAVLLISASYLIGELTAGQDVKIIKDLGLASISASLPAATSRPLARIATRLQSASASLST